MRGLTKESRWKWIPYSRMNSGTNGAATIFRKSTMRHFASWQHGSKSWLWKSRMNFANGGNVTMHEEQPKVVMSSAEFGAEDFEYDTIEEAREGFERLKKECAKSFKKDCIE